LVGREVYPLLRVLDWVRFSPFLFASHKGRLEPSFLPVTGRGNLWPAFPSDSGCPVNFLHGFPLFRGLLFPLGTGDSLGTGLFPPYSRLLGGTTLFGAYFYTFLRGGALLNWGCLMPGFLGGPRALLGFPLVPPSFARLVVFGTLLGAL